MTLFYKGLYKAVSKLKRPQHGLLVEQDLKLYPNYFILFIFLSTLELFISERLKVDNNHMIQKMKSE